MILDALMVHLSLQQCQTTAKNVHRIASPAQPHQQIAPPPTAPSITTSSITVASAHVLITIILIHPLVFALNAPTDVNCVLLEGCSHAANAKLPLEESSTIFRLETTPVILIVMWESTRKIAA